MKKILPLVLMLLSLFLQQTKAQQTTVIPDEQLNNMLKKFRQIQKDAAAQKKFEKDLDASVDEMMVKLDAWLRRKKQEQQAADQRYKPTYQHKAGEMNLFPLWEEMPGPIPSLPEASQANIDAKYLSYTSKVKLMQQQLSDMMQQHIGANRTDKKSMIKDQKAMTDRNGTIQQMGGANAVMNMSEKERKQAAKNAGANIGNDPGATTGIKNSGMNAMAKKMMSDPAYREAYNKMTPAQKEAEMKKFMGNATEERNDAAFEASIRDRNDTYSAANVELLLGESLQQMQEAAKSYAEGTQLANEFFNSVYKNIDDWYKRAYQALPETNAREKIGHHILIRCRETILYAFHKKEAATRTILWNLLKSNTKIAFGKFNDFIGSYPWGKFINESMVDGKYTEPKVAQAVNSLYDEMIRMTGEAKEWTSLFKGQQEQYELALK